MPFHASVAAASLRTLLTSSTVVARLAVKVRSTSETLIVGTRTANPSSLPFNSGSTRPTAAAAPVGVVHVRQYLIVRIGMDRRHDAGDDSYFIVQHLRHRREAIRGARRVGDHRMILLQHIVIDAVNNGGINIVAAWSRYHYFLRAALDVGAGLSLRSEQTSALQHELNTEVAPWQLRRIALGENADAITVD